jgi:hypothetical protein
MGGKTGTASREQSAAMFIYTGKKKGITLVLKPDGEAVSCPVSIGHAHNK